MVGAQSGAAGHTKIGNASRRSRGFPRILKAGYGIKLGAVVSTFFFVRDVCNLFSDDDVTQCARVYFVLYR